jgi:hypothetical protein
MNNIDKNDELASMLVRAHTFIKLPGNQREKVMVQRPRRDEKWYRDVRTRGVGKCCPTCGVTMRRKKFEHDPNAATVEHIVPLSIGGDNKVGGQFPNCIPMCHACNQARNKVVGRYGKTISVVKFLIEQVYCKGVELNYSYLNSFKAFVIRLKTKKPKKKPKKNQYIATTSTKPATYTPKTVEDVAKYDLSHRSSVMALVQVFDQVWRGYDAVRAEHVHESVREGWFPVEKGKGRIQFRSKKKVKRWMKKYLSGQITQEMFLNSFQN